MQAYAFFLIFIIDAAQVYVNKKIVRYMENMLFPKKRSIAS